MSNEGLIIVVGSGGQRYREYLLSSAARRRPLWILDAAEPTWQLPYVAGATVVDLLDRVRLIPDVDQLIKAAAAVADSQDVAGVFSYDETLVVATAHIAEALGLPGLTVTGAESCRNKHRTRQTLTEAGLVQPRFEYVTRLDEARKVAEEFGYPVVIKPRGMGASIGVVRAESAAQLEAAFTVAEGSSHFGNPSYEGGVLVEEFLVGPEISIDGAVFEGEYRPFFVARKRIGLEPYFEEIGHVVSADDPLLTDPGLIEMLSAAHRALGVRSGITHTEVMLTKRGPAIVEVNARLGGDLIPYLGMLATGIDPAHVAVDIAAGVRPALTQTRSKSVGIRFSYPPVDGVIRAVSVPTPGEVPGLVEASPMVEPGAQLLLPPRGFLSRSAFVICETVDHDTCVAALDAAAALTSVELDPIPDADPVADAEPVPDADPIPGR